MGALWLRWVGVLFGWVKLAWYGVFRVQTESGFAQGNGAALWMARTVIV